MNTEKGYIPPSWKDPIGKVLTDRRITHYQALGLLMSNGLVLPPLPKNLGALCILCEGHREVRRRVVSFLPCGNYCESCYIRARDSRDKERELARRVREQSFIYE